MKDDDGGNRSEPDGEPTSKVPEVLPPSQERNIPPAKLLERLLDIEKSRIESADKRTEIMRYAILTNDESDKRQYDYRMTQLTLNDNQQTRRHISGLKVFYISSAVTVTAVFCLLGFAFFGNEKQSDIALKLLIYLFAAVGGYGVVNTLRNSVKKLLNSTSGPSLD